MNRILALFVVISMTVAFCSCNKTPDGSYLNRSSVKTETDTNNTHLNNTDTHIKTLITHGKLTLGIDADVAAPKSQKIYKRKSDYFNFSDKKFHQLAANILLGETYEEKTLQWGDLHIKVIWGELSIEPEKNIFYFISSQAKSLDTSEENFIADDSLNHKYAVMAKDLAVKLGFEQYEPIFCERYGKVDSGNEFYFITLERKIDNMHIENTVFQATSEMDVPPVERIEVEIANGQIWSVYVKAAQIEDEGKSEVAVISLKKALDILENSGVGALSQQIATNEKTEITQISLSYIHISTDKGYKLIPAWTFLIKNEWLFEGEVITEYSYLAIDAETAKIL